MALAYRQEGLGWGRNFEHKFHEVREGLCFLDVQIQFGLVWCLKQAHFTIISEASVLCFPLTQPKGQDGMKSEDGNEVLHINLLTASCPKSRVIGSAAHSDPT